MSDSKLQFCIQIHYIRQINMMNNRGTRLCRRGENCSFKRQGNCWFWHPEEQRQQPRQNPMMRIMRLRNEQNELFERRRRQQEQERVRAQQVLVLMERHRRSILLRNEIMNLQRQRQKKQLEIVEDYNSKPKIKGHILLNDKKVELLEVKSNFIPPKSKSFENLYHFKYFPQFEQSQCSICMNQFRRDSNVCFLFCRHAYHSECIYQWLSQKNSCPLCRQDFTKRQQMKELPKKIPVSEKIQEKKEKQIQIQKIIPSVQQINQVQQVQEISRREQNQLAEQLVQLKLQIEQRTCLSKFCNLISGLFSLI